MLTSLIENNGMREAFQAAIIQVSIKEPMDQAVAKMLVPEEKIIAFVAISIWPMKQIFLSIDFSTNWKLILFRRLMETAPSKNAIQSYAHDALVVSF